MVSLTSTAERARHWLLDLVRDYPGVAVRRALAGGRAGWVGRLPAAVRRRFELAGSVVAPLRVEIGGGTFPSPGYVHVDVDRRSRHLEHVAPAWRLPFADGTVHELLAVHVLEHVRPEMVDTTVREWLRVLAPDGYAEIHVPNAATVFPAFLATTEEKKKWELLIPIFGLNADPPPRRRAARERERHQAIYDLDLLRQVLRAAGFDRVEDVSDVVTDRHTEGWREDELVDRLSLIVRAFPRPSP